MEKFIIAVKNENKIEKETYKNLLESINGFATSCVPREDIKQFVKEIFSFNGYWFITMELENKTYTTKELTEKTTSVYYEDKVYTIIDRIVLSFASGGWKAILLPSYDGFLKENMNDTERIYETKKLPLDKEETYIWFMKGYTWAMDMLKVHKEKELKTAFINEFFR